MQQRSIRLSAAEGAMVEAIRLALPTVFGYREPSIADAIRAAVASRYVADFGTEAYEALIAEHRDRDNERRDPGEAAATLAEYLQMSRPELAAILSCELSGDKHAVSDALKRIAGGEDWTKHLKPEPSDNDDIPF